LRENLQCFWSAHLFPAVQYDIIPGTQKLVIRSSFITPCPHVGILPDPSIHQSRFIQQRACQKKKIYNY